MYFPSSEMNYFALVFILPTQNAGGLYDYIPAVSI